MKARVLDSVSMNRTGGRSHQRPSLEGYFDMKWFKRYVISCLVAMLVFAAVDGYHRPGKDMRESAIIVAAVGWPIVTAIVVGSTVGEIVNEIKQGKQG
jgi:hypothetical protein